MIETKPSTKTLIIIGTGGVGKTTMAASLGVGLALEGKKVLVLTIDPAKRLAQTLGLKPDGNLHKVRLPTSGELWSCVIDHEKAFEYFIRDSAKGIAQPKDIERILKNKLYLQLAGRLSGSQDFTSLITLYRHVQSKEFDLVILDTPPAQHTWNFLRAPEKIAHLFNDRVTKWFRQDDGPSSIFKKILNVGTTQVLKVLELLTGSEFIQELSAFFAAIQTWQKPLESYVKNCHKLLLSKETEFILVTGLDPSRLKEAEKLSSEIRTQGYKLTSVIINRVPEWLTEIDKNFKQKPSATRLSQIIDYYQSLEDELQLRIQTFTSQQIVYKSYEFSQNTEHVEQLKNTYDQMQRLS